mmetsp:Transcript_34943/g.87935  ORF Transcript_34943/g.87935 Transcript_34943/m.87935 type:complete len:232 (-) Transcript_34943:366-1061(-)
MAKSRLASVLLVALEHLSLVALTSCDHLLLIELERSLFAPVASAGDRTDHTVAFGEEEWDHAQRKVVLDQMRFFAATQLEGDALHLVVEQRSQQGKTTPHRVLFCLHTGADRIESDLATACTEVQRLEREGEERAVAAIREEGCALTLGTDAHLTVGIVVLEHQHVHAVPLLHQQVLDGHCTIALLDGEDGIALALGRRRRVRWRAPLVETPELHGVKVHVRIGQFGCSKD